MRIIVTGSRDFTDYLTVARALSVAIDELTTTFPDDKNIVVAQGNCPTGADSFAKEFVNKAQPLLRGRGFRITYIDYNAEWKKYGKAAGPRRNLRMIEDGADLVLAFLQKDARNIGTNSTIRFAEEAGLNVRRYWNVA